MIVVLLIMRRRRLRGLVLLLLFLLLVAGRRCRTRCRRRCRRDDARARHRHRVRLDPRRAWTTVRSSGGRTSGARVPCARTSSRRCGRRRRRNRSRRRRLVRRASTCALTRFLGVQIVTIHEYRPHAKIFLSADRRLNGGISIFIGPSTFGTSLLQRRRSRSIAIIRPRALRTISTRYHFLRGHL